MKPTNFIFRQFPRALLSAALAIVLTSCGGLPTTTTATPTVAEKSGQFSLLWQRQTAAMPDFAQIAYHTSNGIYCTVTKNGSVFFTAPDGTELEDNDFRLPNSVYTAAGCGSDIIAAVNRDGSLIVYDQNGSPLWDTPLHTRVLGTPTVSQGLLLVLSVDGQLLAYTQKTGKLLWQHDSPLKGGLITPVNSAPSTNGENVYIGLKNGSISALDFSNGNRLWDNTISDTKSNNPVTNISNVTTPARENDIVCAAAYQSGVSCLSANNGSVLWHSSLSTRQQAHMSNGQLFIADEDNSVHAFKASNGQRLWKNQSPSLPTSSPLHVGKAVFVGGNNGEVAAFSAKNGDLLGKISLGNSPVIHLLASKDNITALTASGNLTQLQFIYE